MPLELSEIREGIITHQELRRLGWGSKRISSAWKRGDLVRLTRGIYLSGQIAKQCQQRDRALALTLALGLARQSAVISHQSAALLWGAPLLALPPKVHLSLLTSDKSQHAQASFHNRRPQAFEQARQLVGVRVTDPGTTLLDCLRQGSVQECLAIADYFLFQRLIERDDLTQQLARMHGAGAAKARVVAQLASALSESPLESFARLRLYQAGLDLGVQQLPLRTSAGRSYRADFAWPQLKVLLEVDGLHKYFGAYRPVEEQIRQDFLRQRELEQEGWTVVRATWEDLERRPQAVMARLRALGVGPAQG